MSTIKDIWLKIWTWLKPVLKVKGIISFLTSKTFLVIIVVVLVLMIGRSCARNRDAQRINDINIQNIAALTDEIKSEKTKSGKLELTIAGYVLSEKDLKKINEDLYNKIKDEKGKVISLTNVVLYLKQEVGGLRDHLTYLETVMGQPVQLNDSTFKMSWKMKYDWDQLNYDIYQGETTVGLTIKPGYIWRDVIIPTQPLGVIAVDSTIRYTASPFSGNNVIGVRHYNSEIISRESQIEMTFGQKVENNQLRIFLNTNYPGFSASALSGVLIDPNTNPYIKDLMKKKKWIPNTWSVGIGPSFGYNVLQNKPYLGIGVNINYNILQW